MFRAWQTACGREVALKVGKHFAVRPAEHGLWRQAFAMSQLVHRSVPRVLGHGVLPTGESWTITEWVAGTPLRQEPAAATPAAALARWSGRWTVAQQVCSVVAFAHEHGWRHGNLIAEHVVVPVGRRPAVLLGWLGDRCGPGHGESQTCADDVAALGHLVRHLLSVDGAGRPPGADAASFLDWLAAPGGTTARELAERLELLAPRLRARSCDEGGDAAS